MENFKFKDVNGNIQTAQFDPVYGLRPELSSNEVEWSVIATDPDGEEQSDFVGRMSKK